MIAVSNWYFADGAMLLSAIGAIAGVALASLSAVYGAWRAAFSLRTQCVLVVGGVLLLEAVLNFLLWAVATDHDSAHHGVPWGALGLLAALMLVMPAGAVLWLRRKAVA